MLIEISTTANPFSKKYLIRTKGIRLKVCGVQECYKESMHGEYNVYLCTPYAVKRIKKEYPDYKPY